MRIQAAPGKSALPSWCVCCIWRISKRGNRSQRPACGLWKEVPQCSARKQLKGHSGESKKKETGRNPITESTSGMRNRQKCRFFHVCRSLQIWIPLWNMHVNRFQRVVFVCPEICPQKLDIPVRKSPLLKYYLLHHTNTLFCLMIIRLLYIPAEIITCGNLYVSPYARSAYPIQRWCKLDQPWQDSVYPCPYTPDLYAYGAQTCMSQPVVLCG